MTTDAPCSFSPKRERYEVNPCRTITCGMRWHDILQKLQKFCMLSSPDSPVERRSQHHGPTGKDWLVGTRRGRVLDDVQGGANLSGQGAGRLAGQGAGMAGRACRMDR